MGLRGLLEREKIEYTNRPYRFFKLNKDGRRRAYVVFLCHVSATSPESEFIKQNLFKYNPALKRPIKCEGNPEDPSTMASCNRCTGNDSPSCALGDTTSPKFGILVYDLDETKVEDGIKLWEVSPSVLNKLLEIQQDHKIEESVCAISQDPQTNWYNVQYVDSIDRSDRVTDEQGDVFAPALVNSGIARTIVVTDAYTEEELALAGAIPPQINVPQQSTVQPRGQRLL